MIPAINKITRQQKQQKQQKLNSRLNQNLFLLLKKYNKLKTNQLKTKLKNQISLHFEADAISPY